MRGSGPALAADLSRFHTGWAWTATALCLAACVPAGLRWLRVAQREHYLAGAGIRFGRRWWWMSWSNRSAAAAGIAGVVLALWWPPAAIATAAVVAGGPLGLSVRGRTAPLAWTRRSRTLAGTWAVLELAVLAAGVALGAAPVFAAIASAAVPALVDVSCLLTAPLERRLMQPFVARASSRLARVDPLIVAITGSYGKTSTKQHVAHLVGGHRTVVATPASFNNRAGLARAINEQLADGTQIFVAEMGTFGPGEIADLCRWCPPRIAVVTAIGPVHLERFGSEERIVSAKLEITAGAEVVVLAADDPHLRALAGRLRTAGKRVLLCSTVDLTADVCVVRSRPAGDPPEGTVTVLVGGTVVAEGLDLPAGVQPGNVACAVAVAVEVGVLTEELPALLAGLPAVGHRSAAVTAPGGFTILDDTYNANPAGARAALETLAAIGRASGGNGRVVVTPGMVELGRLQRPANRHLGELAARVATDLVVVGRTNRSALEAGAALGGSCRLWRVADRPAAVVWVRAHLGAGDVVLYENDLPDHYP